MTSPERVEVARTDAIVAAALALREKTRPAQIKDPPRPVCVSASGASFRSGSNGHGSTEGCHRRARWRALCRVWATARNLVRLPRKP